MKKEGNTTPTWLQNIEKEFVITINDETGEKMKCVEDVVDHIALNK